MRLNESDWLAIEREFCARKLVNFISRAWPAIEPATAYVHGWHIDAIAAHLEAVSAGEINRLLINVPPGTMKSLAVGVLWPAWEWGPRAQPQLRYVGAAHAQDLAVRDNMRMRRLVKSDWYQRLWPLGLAADQDAKLKFENAATGFRAAVAATAMTGHRGDRVLFDDPHSVEGALSELQRNTVLRVFSETVTTRTNDPGALGDRRRHAAAARAGLSGPHPEPELGYEHLCLPMRFEPERRCITSIGFVDPRTEEGELLFPSGSPSRVVERDEKALGSLAAAGQLQQRPAPRGGDMFPIERFNVAEARPAPDDIAASIRYWDKAGTDGTRAEDRRADCGRADAPAEGRALLHRRLPVRPLGRARARAARSRRSPRATAGASASTSSRSRAPAARRAPRRRSATWPAGRSSPTGRPATRRCGPALRGAGAGRQRLWSAGELEPALPDEHQAFPVGRTKDMVDAARGRLQPADAAEGPGSRA